LRWQKKRQYKFIEDPYTGDMRILLVEDDLMLARSICSLLEESGAEIIHKADAASAKAALAEGEFALVVSDYTLGQGENGDAVLIAAKTQQPLTRRLMMSGSNSAEWVVEAGLAQAFFLKTSRLAGVLLAEVEALSKPTPAL
jgi:DNA-binding NtrC family response regulator